jgi:hypothetical protein
MSVNLGIGDRTSREAIPFANPLKMSDSQEKPFA